MLFSMKSIAFGLTSLLVSQVAAAPLEMSPALAPRNGCTGQGPGSCNFVLFGNLIEELEGEVQWYQATIYNNGCGVIGGVSNPYQGEAIDSQLPYTVDITYLSTYLFGEYQRIGMAYAGYSFTGDFACSQDSSSTVSCAHGFPC